MSNLISEWCQNLLPDFQDSPVPDDPEIISATEAMQWTPGYKLKDMRPRVFNGVTKTYDLVDSGSAITVIPAGPEDTVDPSLHLQTVSGQKVDCCGKKKIEIRLGRKTYSMEAVIAKVKSRIIGWDFICKYKLNWEWDTWGNIHLVDKKSNTSTLMQHILVPQNSLPRFASLDLIRAGPSFSDFLFEPPGTGSSSCLIKSFLVLMSW